MKVVFLETVEGSGAMGEIRDVANGYARNFLLSRGFAAPATPHLLKRAEELAVIEEERQRVEDEQAHQLVGKLEGATLVMAVRVGEQGRLYGSVTNVDIAEKAGEILGEGLDRRRVLLPEVIRTVGLHTVPVRLSRNISTDVTVAVVDAEAPEGVEASVELLLNPPEEPAVVAMELTVEETDGTDTDDVPEPGNDPSDVPASDASDDSADGSLASGEATEEAETS